MPCSFPSWCLAGGKCPDKAFLKDDERDWSLGQSQYNILPAGGVSVLSSSCLPGESSVVLEMEERWAALLEQEGGFLAG